jgi:hypothetical protein
MINHTPRLTTRHITYIPLPLRMIDSIHDIRLYSLQHILHDGIHGLAPDLISRYGKVFISYLYID